MKNMAKYPRYYKPGCAVSLGKTADDNLCAVYKNTVYKKNRSKQRFFFVT